jgi:6,7-dimethyl-8-ribityllumazine synthase
MKIGLVVSEFNRKLTSEMEELAHDTADELGVEIAEEVHVPGAYDSPLAAKRLAERDSIDAVAVVGTVVKGDTAHDEVVVGSAASALTDVSLETDTPITLGIAGPGMSGAEARERVEYGERAVNSAVKLIRNLPE